MGTPGVKVLGTASRCRFGAPRVLVCAPVTARGEPFPTTFWLTCPWLVRQAGAVESASGVRRLEAYLTGREADWRAWNRLHQLLRLGLMTPAQRAFLSKFRPRAFHRLRRGGVGGILPAEGIYVKCLHLQTASWIALGRHPGAEWLSAEGLDEDCGGLCPCEKAPLP